MASGDNIERKSRTQYIVAEPAGRDSHGSAVCMEANLI